MPEDKETILVVEDDFGLAEMLTAYFQAQGYEVEVANCGLEAVQKCHTAHPDLVILDIRLPDFDGFEVARQLRSYPRLLNTPIIFLTEKRARADRLKGLEMGADDYIIKPFDIRELGFRVRNALQRMKRGAVTDPITGLAGEILVDERLRQCLGSRGWAILLVVVENLGEFKAAYDFAASDEVQKAASLMIRKVTQSMGRPDDFIGQLDFSKFILVTSPVVVQDIAQQIRARLEQSLDYFYPMKDPLKLPPDKRLAIRLGQLTDEDGVFAKLEDLKAALYSRLS